jgi:hypothetical protein
MPGTWRYQNDPYPVDRTSLANPGQTAVAPQALLPACVFHTAWLMVLAACCFLRAQRSGLWDFQQIHVSPVWLPAEVALAAVLLRRPGVLPAVGHRIVRDRSGTRHAFARRCGHRAHGDTGNGRRGRGLATPRALRSGVGSSASYRASDRDRRDRGAADGRHGRCDHPHDSGDHTAARGGDIRAPVRQRRCPRRAAADNPHARLARSSHAGLSARASRSQGVGTVVRPRRWYARQRSCFQHAPWGIRSPHRSACRWQRSSPPCSRCRPGWPS